jgi:hypothetical protein
LLAKRARTSTQRKVNLSVQQQISTLRFDVNRILTTLDNVEEAIKRNEISTMGKMKTQNILPSLII